MASERKVAVSSIYKVKIVKWFVKQGQNIRKDSNIASYVYCDRNDSSCDFLTERKLKSRFDGSISNILCKSNVEITPGTPVIAIVEEQCKHTVVMKEMCCECGADLRLEASIPGELAEPVSAEVSMVHNIPELRVSFEVAERIAKSDEKKLLQARKLALVVDLDQTLIHTTHEEISGDMQDVFNFRLPDQPFEYHTKARPGAKHFLETISRLYELHIFTMGSRLYAHTIARHLDPEEKLFAHRIRSRDECLDGFSKSQDLRALFPCGDHMVCIIDDREDVWNFAPNLVTVKPYRYFTGTGDINDPFANKQNTDKSNALDKNLAIDDDAIKRYNSNEANGKPERLGEMEGKESENSTGKHDDIPKEGSNIDREVKEMKKDAADSDPGNKKADKGKNDTKKQVGNFSVDTQFSGADVLHDLDDYLYYLEEILERVHRTFYTTLDEVKSKGGISKNDPEIVKFCTPDSLNPDTRAIVPALRKETLKGASIVFTGVVPVHVPLIKSVPYRTAVELGATVTQSIITRKTNENTRPSDASTHVIAARLGTEKAYRAGRLPHVRLVNPDWLWCCAQRWEWVEEQLFPVQNRDATNGVSTPEVSGRGTPVLGITNKRNDPNKYVSPLTEEYGLPNGPPTPDEIIDTLGPTTFSKDELDEMDKEVEEYMLSDKDGEEEEDCLGSVSGSSHRESGCSKTDSRSSCNSNKSSSSLNSTEFSSKRKQDDSLDDESFGKYNKKLRVIANDNSAQNNVDDDVIMINSDSSDEDSSVSGESDSEDDIGALVERQLSNASPFS